MLTRRLTKTELKDNWARGRFKNKISKLAKKLGTSEVRVRSRVWGWKTFPLVYLFDPSRPYIIATGETAFYVKSLK